MREFTCHDMNPDQLRAARKIPRCVNVDCIDHIGTWSHVVFRVEHVVESRQVREDFYTQREANACKRWLAKYCPNSEYAEKE
jgi:hypothetical protein